jgi:hypothetical protein
VFILHALVYFRYSQQNKNDKQKHHRCSAASDGNGVVFLLHVFVYFRYSQQHKMANKYILVVALPLMAMVVSLVSASEGYHDLGILARAVQCKFLTLTLPMSQISDI